MERTEKMETVPQQNTQPELTIVQRRAISMLSMGETPMNVAQSLDISRQTLFRWRQLPDFIQALDRAVAELNLNARAQVEATARIAIEGGLDAVTQLRNIVLRLDTSDHDRRLSCMNLVRVTERFWDLMGYNAKLPNKQTLLCDQLDKLNDAVHVGDPYIPRPPEPGDRHLRPDTEVDPPPAGCDALCRPPEFYDWRHDPRNEDGTPKNPSEPEPPPPEPEPPAINELQAEAARQEDEEEDDDDPIQLAPAKHTSSPQSKPKPKAWKRSATTLRCKPEKSSTPNVGAAAAGAQRSTATTPAAHKTAAPNSTACKTKTSTPTQNTHGPG